MFKLQARTQPRSESFQTCAVILCVRSCSAATFLSKTFGSPFPPQSGCCQVVSSDVCRVRGTGAEAIVKETKILIRKPRTHRIPRTTMIFICCSLFRVVPNSRELGVRLPKELQSVVNTCSLFSQTSCRHHHFEALRFSTVIQVDEPKRTWLGKGTTSVIGRRSCACHSSVYRCILVLFMHVYDCCVPLLHCMLSTLRLCTSFILHHCFFIFSHIP